MFFGRIWGPWDMGFGPWVLGQIFLRVLETMTGERVLSLAIFKTRMVISFSIF